MRPYPVHDPLWWFTLANCAGEKKFLSYGPASARKKQCQTCIAVHVCLWYALINEAGHGEEAYYGIYGYLTPDERRSMVARHGITAGQARAEYRKERKRLWVRVEGATCDRGHQVS